MKYRNWILWSLASLLLAGYLGWTLLGAGDKSLFLVGVTSDGHHQIELACESCHTSAFGGGELLQEACEGCHLEELRAVRDSHPRRKFTDPANADRVAILDARVCVTCHREHQEDLTRPMAVTVPDDVCFLCHEDVGTERASHAGLPFAGCASSGCHNFHDNTALYEDFLVENADRPWLADDATVPALGALRALLEAWGPGIGLDVADADGPAGSDPAILRDWSESAHARGGINCGDCHRTETGDFVAKPAVQQLCSSCHESQNSGFLAGRHGMRLAAGLSPMTPAQARLPMHAAAAGRELNCVSCHGPHASDRRFAAVEACESCHASEHVAGFRDSPHGRLFADSLAGRIPEAAGVSCATCHMPRISSRENGAEVVHAEHNQNANLRPSDKMLRTVCMNCHSLEFSIDALADPALAASNYRGRPARHIESIDMAVQRRDEIMKDRDTTYH